MYKGKFRRAFPESFLFFLFLLLRANRRAQTAGNRQGRATVLFCFIEQNRTPARLVTHL